MLELLFGRKKRNSALESLFGAYVQPNFLKALPDQLRLHAMPIEFIFVATRGDDVQLAADALSLAVEQLAEGRWMVLSLMGPLVMAARGTPVDAPDAMGRQLMAERLTTKLGPRGKVIHGQRQAGVGDLGSATRRSYGALIQDQLELLAALHSAPWGTAISTQN